MAQKIGVQSQDNTYGFDPVKAQRNEILNRIFDLLQDSNVSQKEFAQMLQIRPQTVTDWRKGKSNSFMKKLGEIAAVLGTTTIWLFYGAEAKTSIAEL